MCRYCLLGTVLAMTVAQSVANGNERYWNQFRGPSGNGQSVAKNLPVEFSETNNVRWKIPIFGKGWSSPVVWGQQVWVTTGIKGGKELFAICVHAETGKVVHQIKVFDVADPNMEYSKFNPHATPTSFVEAGRIYVHYGSYGTACLNTASGKVIWRRQNLKCQHRVGPASSPVVSGDSLFLQFDGVDVQYVVALNKANGKTLWRKKRAVQSDIASRLRKAGLSENAIRETIKKKPGDNRKSYSTPTLIEFQGRQQLISPGAEVLFSYNPKNGEELWRIELDGMSFNVACRPILANGLLYVTSGIAKELLAIRPDGRGDVTKTHVTWMGKRGVPNLSSPILVDGLLFMVSDQGGVASCLDAKTGEQVWRKRIASSGGHWASPIYADGKIYFSDRSGGVTVIAAKRKLETIARNKLQANFNASPAVAGESLIFRSTTHLYCLAKGYTRSADQVAASDKKPPKKESVDWEKAYQRLLKTNPAVKQKVDNGDATKEQVIAWLKKNRQGKKGKKGRGRVVKNGTANFYAIVIGRLISKDIELGVFTLDVDHVTSMYGNRWVKDAIVGKKIKVTSVSGRFRDALLLIKRGQTLKFRSGSYQTKSKSLTFGSKFHVLERAKPFNPAAYGVPPKRFRGFQGVLQGKIAEIGGYEVVLRVQRVVKLSPGNSAADANSIKGKLVRLVGFYGRHQKLYKDLHAGDLIRASASHGDPTFDEFRVTQVLEKVKKK